MPDVMKLAEEYEKGREPSVVMRTQNGAQVDRTDLYDAASLRAAYRHGWDAAVAADRNTAWTSLHGDVWEKPQRVRIIGDGVRSSPAPKVEEIASQKAIPDRANVKGGSYRLTAEDPIISIKVGKDATLKDMLKAVAHAFLQFVDEGGMERTAAKVQPEPEPHPAGLSEALDKAMAQQTVDCGTFPIRPRMPHP